jgi:hypothetical protein
MLNDECVILANVSHIRERMSEGRISGDEVSMDDLECLLTVVENYVNK